MAIIIREYLHDDKVLLGFEKSIWGVTNKQAIAWA
jgi:hypothetical protein